MKKAATACLALAAACGMTLLVAGQTPQAVMNIAVSGYTVTGFAPPEIYEGYVLDAFTEELAGLPGIKILDRRRLDAVLREQELSLSDIVDSNTAVEVGNILGAGCVLIGSLAKVEGGSALFSCQLIDTTTGEVVFAATDILTGDIFQTLKAKVGDFSGRLVRRLSGSERGRIDSLWLAAGAPSSPNQPVQPAKPILIYILSNVKDSVDPNGQWYLGPQQIKPVTDTLRKEGFAVEVHDRRTLSALSKADLGRYSEVWLLEGDGDGTVQETPADIQALTNFYTNGGGVWLSGENVMDVRDTSWTEDVNAFAKPFGVQIQKILIQPEPRLTVGVGSHPLLENVRALVFDDEVGILAVTNRAMKAIAAAPAAGRIVPAPWTIENVRRNADPARLKQLATGAVKDYTLEWLFGANFSRVGTAVPADTPVIAALDESSENKGRLVIDGGWVLGWAFTQAADRITSTADDLAFCVNAARWLGRQR
jgi:hypothetical protein